MAGSKHVTAADLRKLHQPPEGAGGKGCLTRHQGRAKGNKCSHQWQAGVKARSHWRVYEIPDRPEWSVLSEGNFEHFKVPYWHNAHHIIPNGALKAAIAKVGKETAGMTNLIKQGLLKATYNLNDKINMVILPMQRYHARKVGLPRHLRGDRDETRSHPAYSDQAESKLAPIMDGFKSIAADALKAVEGTHDKPDAVLSKAQLEELSSTLYANIRAAGKVAANLGKSLSQLSSQIFNFG
jgi:hypothetical protein